MAGDEIEAVLDASALLAYLQEEDGGQVVGNVLEHAGMSTVNLAEVLTVAVNKLGEDPPTLRAQLSALGIRVFDFTVYDAEIVAGLWKTTKPQGLSLGDRACLALGRRLAVKVYTAEQHRDWSKLGLEGIEIVAIRSRSQDRRH